MSRVFGCHICDCLVPFLKDYRIKFTTDAECVYSVNLLKFHECAFLTFIHQFFFHHQEFKLEQDMAEKSAITGFIAFFCLLSSAFFIASIVVAVQDGDDLCQGQDKTMSLKTWLLVTGNLGFRCTDSINC